ncbi:MAG: 1,3-beta-galactosyl-N-acetylhexosamine phosphorylase [Anaerolineaceae bacterium]|nr:MAG: 1,3-beta-galactosyl-N-acetylhexosamine phosphorylase [Anaerolineaceae bacterium]
MNNEAGSFTLPGEAGYEELTLKMAKKWGADAIRDSDGTQLSELITKAGYEIYSTICIIRDHNKWAKQNMDKLQQTFLVTNPVVAVSEVLTIHLMEGYFDEQFKINDSDEAIKYIEVYDRTTEKKLMTNNWVYEKEAGNIVIEAAIPFHSYTVSFLAYRIWEEISMYNHVTNSWIKEHQMPIDPRWNKVQRYLIKWMEDWCKQHPDTTVVRFTSMFYNFVWIWGQSERNRNIFSDWASYDFTVSPLALAEFQKQYGYPLYAEDFINQGKFHVTHMPANKKQLDYIEFTNRFVVDFGKQLIDIVHKYGKKAYVFYDDSWIGVEPYSKLFPEFGFDGLIKCVFSGFEARLCAGVDVETHELRLHPYLFPVGLGGAPTFTEGGNPTLDAKRYWNRIRRALLRKAVDRIGLGGYLHLVENYPDFCDYIEQVGNEFRLIKAIHKKGGAYILPCRVAVVHSWGRLRSWSLSGHFHENYIHDLIHINEALSGLPVDVGFLSFEDIKLGALEDFDVVINAGRAATAWSGGDAWKDEKLISILHKWVHKGGTFLGVGSPSAVEGYINYFRMAHILGIDEDTGARVCHGRLKYEIDKMLRQELVPEGADIIGSKQLYLADGRARVIAENNGVPVAVVNEFGKGKGIYLGGFTYNNANTRMLLNLLLYGTGLSLAQKYIPSNCDTECAYYPQSKEIVVINNSDKQIDTHIMTATGLKNFTLEAYEMQIGCE